MIFIVAKIGIVVFMLASAVCMYHAKYKKCTMIPIMLIIYIVVLLTLIALDLTSKYIVGFFLMIYMSNLFNFIGFYKILQNLPGAPGLRIMERTRWYFRTMVVLYSMTLALAFIPRFGPWCHADKVYPACMNWTACLFIINFIFHCVMNCKKDYFLDAGEIRFETNLEEVASPTDINAVESTDESTLKKNLDWTDDRRASKLSKKMFRK